MLKKVTRRHSVEGRDGGVAGQAWVCGLVTRDDKERVCVGVSFIRTDRYSVFHRGY